MFKNSKKLLVGLISTLVMSASLIGPAMATTATATQKASLEINLNGTTYKIETSKNITSMSKAYSDVVIAPSGSFVSVMAVSATAGPGTFATIGSAIIVNDDPTNAAVIELTKATADTVYVQLDAGKAVLINNIKIQANADASAFSAFTDITAVKAKGVTGNVPLRILAVGT
jgi:hypothetical protein